MPTGFLINTLWYKVLFELRKSAGNIAYLLEFLCIHYLIFFCPVFYEEPQKIAKKFGFYKDKHWFYVISL